MSELGTLVRRRRMELGLTQVELGERLTLSPSYISHIELGHSTPTDDETVEKLARVLELKPQVVYYAVGRLPPFVRYPGMTDEHSITRAYTAFHMHLIGAM